MTSNSISINKGMLKIINKIFEILPGLLVCTAIAFTGQYLGQYVPSLGGASLAIFIGMAFGNTLGNKEIFEEGSKFAEKDLLSYSIVLLGGTLSAQTILQLGFTGVSFIILQMVITICATMYIGKRLGFSQSFRFLMASGNAVCGSSAIAATAPVIDAKDEDKGITITIVNVMGTVLMLLLPVIASLVFSTETVKTSALIGGTLQSVGQVVASGSMVSEPVKDLATIFKIVRIIFLVFVVLSFGKMKNKTSNKDASKPRSKAKVPWYVIGFFIMCALFTAGILTSEISTAFKSTSHYFEIIALAGIGMRVNFKHLLAQGVKSSMYALGVGAVQILAALSLIGILL